MTSHTAQPSLARYALLSIAAAIATIILKGLAYLFTGSVGLFSDAMESFVNLVGGLMAYMMLKVAEQPADENHAYGHTKAEYFSSGLEGLLILGASVSIAWTASLRLLSPTPLENIGLGLAISVAASGINLGTALLLHRAGKKYRSITLEANANHLLTDVWTSAGVLVAILAVAATGWLRLDPLIAMAVAANIAWAAYRILRKSVYGLMDAALPRRELEAVRGAIEHHMNEDVHYHALRTRRSGARCFVSLHVLVPGDWSVQRGHTLCEEIEADIRLAVSPVTVFTHLEPAQDPASYDDIHLERPQR
jgi:cation diffusion facilitator family transporter